MKITNGFSFSLIAFLFLIIFPTLQSCRPLVIDGLAQRGIELSKEGHYSEALAVTQQCLQMAKPYGKMYNYCGYIAGRAYLSLEQFHQAIQLYEDILDNAERDRWFYLIQNVLARAYERTGDYAKAESLYKSVISSAEETDNEYSTVADSMSGLAFLYSQAGEYTKAEKFARKAVEISKNDPDMRDTFAGGLNVLGNIYRDIGDYDQAEANFLEFIEITKEQYGKSSIEYAHSINNMATLYLSKMEYTKALPLFMQSMDLKQKITGETSVDIAGSFSNLGLCYMAIDDFAEAETYLEKAMVIYMDKYGAEHPLVASTQDNLGTLAFKMRNYSKAEVLFGQVINYLEKNNRDNSFLATTLFSQARIMAVQGKTDLVWNHVTHANKLRDILISEVLGFTTEQQQLLFLAGLRSDINITMNLANQHFASNQEVLQDCLNTWLRRKGIVLEAQKEYQEALFHSDDPEVSQLFKELAEVRANLSRLVLSKPIENNSLEYKDNIVELEAKKELLEKRLSGLSKKFAMNIKKQQVNTQQIAKILPKGSVLIEFIRLDPYDGMMDNSKNSMALRPSHYLAFVLRAGNSGRVELIDLGVAEPIEASIKTLKEALDGGNTNPESSRSAKLVMNASNQLHKMVFIPLKKTLGNSSDIFLSPDGALNLLPFEILCDDKGKFLIQDYTFNYLATGRDVLSFGRTFEQSGRNLIMGDPDFDLNSKNRHIVLQQLSLNRGREVESTVRSRDLQNFKFERLEGTREEVAAIRTILGNKSSDFFLGKEALEEVLTSRRSPKILHLATHGFYLKDQELPPTRTSAGFGSTAANSKDAVVSSSRNFIYENPLIRSGVALAGANTSNGSQAIGKNDGIVTAEKILSLNLQGTNLVVISACESGLGMVKNGEGVFGLRRAFNQAGAKSMLTSMWSVPDNETKELMTIFYENIQFGSMDRAQALRHAALQEMAVVKKRYGHANPFYWGAFTFAGER